jgi:Asp-tRNA(Asn)/Glu-tRNA(Gln) amidotransferase A subunit family amidase
MRQRLGIASVNGKRKSDGVPIGMMIAHRDYDESTNFHASQAFETSIDWKTIT